MGQDALAIGPAGAVYRLLGGSHPPATADLGAVVASGAVFFLVSTGLTEAGRSLARGPALLRSFRPALRFHGITAAPLLIMAPVLTAAERSLALVPLSAVPVAALLMGARASLERARLAGLNELKDDFVAMASHELRAPLASIQGSVKTALNLGPDPAPGRPRAPRGR